MIPCNHHFCQDCLEKCVANFPENTRLISCPKCRSIFDRELDIDYDDTGLHAISMAFKINCMNKKNGCDFVGNYETVEDHEFICIKGDDDLTFCEVCLEEMLCKFKEKHNCIITMSVIMTQNKVLSNFNHNLMQN